MQRRANLLGCSQPAAVRVVDRLAAAVATGSLASRVGARATAAGLIAAPSWCRSPSRWARSGAALPAGAIGLGPVLLLGPAVVMAAGLFRPPPGILGT